MKILIICSGNHNHGVSSFIREQVDSLVKLGVEIDYFLIRGKGTFGYLKNYGPLLKKIKQDRYNLIHAHHGLSGMLAVLQRKVPVLITFHGGDIDQKGHWPISFLASRLSAKNIYVHKQQAQKIFDKKNRAVIACGIDLNLFKPSNREESRKRLRLDIHKKYILFASSFSGRPEKNYPIARMAVDTLGENVELLELKGYDRETVSLLFSAVDVLLVTSSRETGPLVVKEALACNCPVVSTDVGDVASVIKGVEGCFLTSQDPFDIASKLKRSFLFGGVINGRHKVENFDLQPVGKRVLAEYQTILNHD